MKFTLNNKENYERLCNEITGCDTEDELGYAIDAVEDAFLAGYIDGDQYRELNKLAIEHDDYLYSRR